MGQRSVSLLRKYRQSLTITKHNGGKVAKFAWVNTEVAEMLLGVGQKYR